MLVVPSAHPHGLVDPVGQDLKWEQSWSSFCLFSQASCAQCPWGGVVCRVLPVWWIDDHVHSSLHSLWHIMLPNLPWLGGAWLSTWPKKLASRCQTDPSHGKKKEYSKMGGSIYSLQNWQCCHYRQNPPHQRSWCQFDHDRGGSRYGLRRGLDLARHFSLSFTPSSYSLYHPQRAIHIHTAEGGVITNYCWMGGACAKLASQMQILKQDHDYSLYWSQSSSSY